MSGLVPSHGRRSGFTLLEVMVAIALLGLSLTAIFSSQAGAIKTAHRARKLQTGSLLARCKMGEIEEELQRNGFPAVESKGVDGCCEDAEIEGFECEWLVSRIVLPDPMDMEEEGGEELPIQGRQDDEPGTTATVDQASQLGIGGSVDSMLAGDTMGGGMIDQIVMGYAYPILKPTLEEQVRRVNVTVRWREGTAEKSFDVGRFVVGERGAIAPGSGEALEEALESGGAGR